MRIKTSINIEPILSYNINISHIVRNFFDNVTLKHRIVNNLFLISEYDSTIVDSISKNACISSCGKATRMTLWLYRKWMLCNSFVFQIFCSCFFEKENSLGILCIFVFSTAAPK